MKLSYGKGRAGYVTGDHPSGDHPSELHSIYYGSKAAAWDKKIILRPIPLWLNLLVLGAITARRWGQPPRLLGLCKLFSVRSNLSDKNLTDNIVCH